MVDAIRVVVHDTEHTDTWPTSVANIWSSLSYPLPQHLASSDVRDCLSPCVRELYDEVLQSLAPGFGDQGETDRTERTVKDVIDTLLSYTRMARASYSFDRGAGWISILTVLGVGISKGAFVL